MAGKKIKKKKIKKPGKKTPQKTELNFTTDTATDIDVPKMVGEILKKGREETGKDLREISKTLKIKYDCLKAIEDGAFEELPAEVYIKGYIREYAEILNIDPEIAIKAYIQQISPTEAENKEVPEKEVTRKKNQKIRYLLISVLLVLLMITITFILFPSSREKSEIPPPPVETKSEIPPPPVETKSEIPPPPAETKSEIPPPPAETKKDNVLKMEKFPHILEVSATDTTWLFVTIDKTSIKEVLLKPGESVKLQAINGFSLKIGNAGGVKLVFDKKEIGKLGEKGQVIEINLPYDKM